MRLSLLPARRRTDAGSPKSTKEHRDSGTHPPGPSRSLQEISRDPGSFGETLEAFENHWDPLGTTGILLIHSRSTRILCDRWDPLKSFGNHWSPGRISGNLGELLGSWGNHWKLGESLGIWGNHWKLKGIPRNP